MIVSSQKSAENSLVPEHSCSVLPFRERQEWERQSSISEEIYKKSCINCVKLLFPTQGMPSMRFLRRVVANILIPVHSCHSGSGRNEEGKSTSLEKNGMFILPFYNGPTILTYEDWSIIACGSLFLGSPVFLSAFDWLYVARIFMFLKK